MQGILNLFPCSDLTVAYWNKHHSNSLTLKCTPDRAEIGSVEVCYCGQGGYFCPRDPHCSLAFKDLKEDGAGSYVRGSSIHHGYNTAIGVYRSKSIELWGYMIYRTTDSSVNLEGLLVTH